MGGCGEWAGCPWRGPLELTCVFNLVMADTIQTAKSSLRCLQRDLKAVVGLNWLRWLVDHASRGLIVPARE